MSAKASDCCVIIETQLPVIDVDNIIHLIFNLFTNLQIGHPNLTVWITAIIIFERDTQQSKELKQIMLKVSMW